MRSGRLGTALLCGCFLATPVLAADPGKNVDGDNLPPGAFTGKLVSTPGTDGLFTVNVEFDRVVLRPGANQSENREVQQLVRDQQRVERTENELVRARNASEYRRLAQQLSNETVRLQERLVQLQLTENGDYTIKREYKNVDFHTADAVKVRIMNPPLQFDDKGNAKQYTKDELEAMKGKDKDLPGYESTLDSLKVGDTIKVTLSTPKPAKKDDKDSDPKADPDAKAPNTVTRILILSEDNSDNGKPKGKK
jgi:hypothetical protein